MSLYLGTNLISGVATPIQGARNIGQIIQSTIPLTDAGLHLLDGSLISGEGSYKAFYDYIVNLYNSYPQIYTDEAGWQSSVSTYGVCGKFVFNTTNKTVRLPKITGFTEGTIDPTALGSLVQAGLPDITGSVETTHATRGMFWEEFNTSGAFTQSDKKGYWDNAAVTQSNVTSKGLYFNAHDSNSIYGNSTTVQPQSIKVLYYIVIATSTKTDIEVDIDEVMTDLNGKADVDLSNVKASGTSLASGWSMPSSRYIDLTLGASGTSYTAPANGYFVLNKLTTNTNQYANFINQTNGMNTNLSYPTSGSNIRIYMPVLKRHIVSCSYSAGGTTKWFRFIYAEGESNV